MSLYKRGNYWWLNITKPNGERVRYPAKTTDRKASLELHDRLKAEYWRTKQLGEKPRYTWQEAVNRWLNENEHKASLKDDVFHLRWLHNHLFDKCLDEILRDDIDRIRHARLSDGVSNATVNRLLEVLRALLNRAYKEWEWIDSVPYVRLLPEPKRRIRWLTEDEAARLIKALPEHIASMVRFSLATGLRESNVTQIEWSQVDLNRKCAWIHADQAKAKKAIPVPLNARAMDVLKSQLGKDAQYVFTYKNKPVAKANNHAWRKALKRVGIEDFRWHDLRHTWATWHVQKGTPLNVLQELGGWSDIRMVQRYAHLSSDRFAHFAEMIA